MRKVLASNAWLAFWLFVAISCAFMGVRANHRPALSDARGAVTRTNTPSTTRHQPEYRTREIQDLRKGDTVLTMDPETGKLEKHRIIDAFSRTSDHLRILEFLGVDGTSQTLETTDEHPFLSVSAADFVSAGELATGDQFVGPAGQLQTLTATHREEHPEGVAVYNFEVEDAHTYFVMAYGSRAPPVLVHNATGGVCPVPSGAPNSGLTTPGKFFGGKTAQEARDALGNKFGPARSSRPGADTFYNPKTGRSFNVHTDPAHGPPHVDIRTRGPIPDRKFPLQGGGD